MSKSTMLPFVPAAAFLPIHTVWILSTILFLVSLFNSHIHNKLSDFGDWSKTNKLKGSYFWQGIAFTSKDWDYSEHNNEKLNILQSPFPDCSK